LSHFAADLFAGVRVRPDAGARAGAEPDGTNDGAVAGADPGATKGGANPVVDC
jgi:hypothetical protein